MFVPNFPKLEYHILVWNALSLTKEIGKQENSVLYNFIWNSGQDKIK